MTSWLAVYTGNCPFYLGDIIRYNHCHLFKDITYRCSDNMANQPNFTDEEYKAFAELMDSYNRTFAVSITTLVLAVIGFIIAEVQVGYLITNNIRWLFGLLVMLPLAVTSIGTKYDFNHLTFSMPKTILYSVLNVVSLATIVAIVVMLNS